jgi:protein gp37
VMALCPQHTFQILTKRPEGMLAYIESRASESGAQGIYETMAVLADARKIEISYKWLRWPLPNVWLGVSVENQAAADERIPLLLKTPSAVRFISAEPVLGLIDVTNVRPMEGDIGHAGWVAWVICGGESGPGARPMHPDWARSLRDQCVAASVPFFFKQWGEYAPVDGSPLYGMAKVGKKAAGTLLDGREWKQFPA